MREIKEELNIEIEILQKFDDKSFEYDTFSIILIPFLSKYVKGEIILAEHNDFKWLSSEELKGLDWAAADELIIEEFLKLNLDAARTL